MAHYEIIVGNIGRVFEDSNGFEAHNTFQVYASQSKQGYGRAAGESVALFKDGEIVKEYLGTIDQVTDQDGE